MKAVAVALLATLVVVGARAETCVAQATAKNLAGAAKTSFLTKCTSDAVR